ncbi:MAG: GNAT family N-acetyltransferase [Anaerolineales bacterium]|nr:GNAT family N-acetyltransferase [Anaerolineales bacterium]
MTDATYRHATEEDLPIVAGMYAKLDAALRGFGLGVPEVPDVGGVYAESFRRTLGRFSAIILAELDGEVVGYQAVRIKRLPAYMGGVLVGETAGKWTEPQARRTGIGTRLTRLGLEWLREQGAESVEIQIPEGNTASWELFKRLGFKPEWRLYRLAWDDYVTDKD